MRMLFVPAALILFTAPGASAEDKVQLEVVKLDALKSVVAKHKGKVVVVDFWATFCIPCKKEFPNLVQLHKDRAGDGVVCISVTVDDSEDSEKALKFLNQQRASFSNYLLDAPAADYQKEFGFEAVPCVLVYDKDGKLAQRFTNSKKEFTYADVRKVVEPLLK
jgi:thiol-disulfide isomerase/thioredoxin